MIIPIGHENLKGRRWPVVSFVLIALNILFFLVTQGELNKQQEESPQRAQTRYHILVLSARFPTWVQMTPEVQTYVDNFKQEHPHEYEMLTANTHKPEDAWEVRLLMNPDWEQDKIKSQMDELCQDFVQAGQTESSTFLATYAFVPNHPTPQSFLTSMFLHVGWLHLIGNMWFLWLAGSILEDSWGRVVFPIFYLVAGVAASFAHLLMSPHSDIPALGASGAVAGLMGAFLARFPKVRIRLAWIIPLGFRIRLFKFSAPAYFILPLWLAGEIFSGILAMDHVGHWAHIGGFVAGVGGAFLLRASGLEHAVDKKIEEKVTWTAEPEIARANELLDQNQFDEAIAAAEELLKKKPNSVDAYEVILKVHEKMADYGAQKVDLGNLCRIYAATGNGKAAWDCYCTLLNLGVKDLAPATWLEIARYLEKDQATERALEEYQGIIQKYPNDRACISALIASAKIYLKLNRVADAERMYRAAEASPVPHLDMEGMIALGLKQCATAASAASSATAGSR